MRIKVSNAKKLSGIILLLGTVGLLTISPSVDAMMTPDFDTDPLFPVQGGTVDLIWTGDQPDAPHQVNNIRVLPPSASGITNTGNADTVADQGTCTAGAKELRKPSAADDGHVFELQETASKAISFFIADAGHTITVPFPNGPGGTVSITASGAGTSASMGTAKWVDITDSLTPQAPALDETGFYSIDSCGTDDGGPWKLEETLEAKPPVGGALLAIETTSLLIAGATSSAMWILPVLGLAVAGSIALLKFQVARRA